jgi:hypothetical protein
MPRSARLTDSENPTIYHVMSRTALDGFPMGASEKDYFLNLIQAFSSLYFAEILGFTILDNHFHIAVKMHPADYINDDELMKRLKNFYGKDREFSQSEFPAIREKLSDLSSFMKDIKQNFTRWYNKCRNRHGFFWGGRFKSVIVEKGETLINLLAYIDLNSIRAGIVEKPEEYRWSSIAYHAQTGNRNNWLSTDFGLDEWGDFSTEEKIVLYRQFVYEVGAVGEKGVIPAKVVESGKKNKYRYSTVERFRLRTRWFTDSGIIGSKKFVESKQRFFKDVLNKDKPGTWPVCGLESFFSLKRLSEG